MIRNTRHFMAPFCLFGVALLMLACGKSSSDNSNSSSSTRENEQVREGRIYKSQLLPLNSIVSGSSIGFLEWVQMSSRMRIHLSMTNTPEDMEHYQAIHSGNKCPTMNADLNSDEIIDMDELERVSGKMLFELDSDLSSQKGDFSQSRSNNLGNYVYWQEAEINRMRSIASNFSPENKVVVIYGVHQNYNLPSSVYAKEGIRHRFVPISCGVIKEAPAQTVY